MSCGGSCPCHFKWLVDVQGSKRDPVNSEKAWLDFAVRLLSREVVGKGKGQEAVWSDRCRPLWWDSEVRLPWKNPTANPKDTKEVLLRKYTALEQRLRKEGRFPQELEDEARLWEAGKYKELFLQTSLASLLGKVMGVHLAVNDAIDKVKELKAEVNLSLVNDLQQCLASSLKVINSLNSSVASKESRKRHSPVTENEASCEKKKSNHFTSTEQAGLNCVLSLSRKPKETRCNEQKAAQTKDNAVRKREQRIQPKSFSSAGSENRPLSVRFEGIQPQGEMTEPGAVTLPSATTLLPGLNHLILGPVLVVGGSGNTQQQSPDAQLNQLTFFSSISSHLSKATCNKSSPNTSPQHTEVTDPNNYPNNVTQLHNMGTYVNNPSPMHTEEHISKRIDVLISIPNTQTNTSSHSKGESLSSDSIGSFSKSNSQSEPSNTSSPIHTTSDSLSSRLWDSLGPNSDTEPEYYTSDTDCNTHSSWADLDYSTPHSQPAAHHSQTHGHNHTAHHNNMARAHHNITHHNLTTSRDFDCSPHEQEPLWKEDGSYLLERFLEDLDDHSRDSTNSFCH